MSAGQCACIPSACMISGHTGHIFSHQCCNAKHCVCCAQAITKNTAHPFCIRQYATFQDKHHLYFLFDLMPGGDLMDVLVAEAKVIRQRVPNSAWQVACLAPRVSICFS